MKLLKISSQCILLLFLLSVNISLAEPPSPISPPAPIEPRVTIYEGPEGLSSVLVPSYDNKDNRYSFYSLDQKYRLSLETSLPTEGQKIKYEFEKFKSYICTGTAIVLSSEHDPVIAIFPVPLVSFNKLIVQLNQGYCNWTDDLIHPRVTLPFSGLFEINKFAIVGPCKDLQLENAALQAEIEKLMYENEKLIKHNASLEFSLNILASKIESLKATIIDLNHKAELLSNVRDAFSKTKPNSFSSLKALYSSLKKLLVLKVVPQVSTKPASSIEK